MILADRRVRWAAIATGGLVVVFLLGLGAFPWGVFKGRIEHRLAAAVGHPVTIGSMRRATVFSYHPTIVFRDVRVPQPDWAGQGDLARIGRAAVSLDAFALLVGDADPRAIAVSDTRVALVRDAARRENWRRGKHGGDGTLSLDRLRVTNTIVTYRDAAQQRAFAVRLAADASGLRVQGKGSVRGNPVTVAARGPAIGTSGKWPFRAAIDGAALTMHATGAMDRPLDTQHLSVDLTAQASDLKLIDAIVEAGLFGTQPVDLTAHARRDGRTWTITGAEGMIGQSDFAGRATVRKEGGRTKVNGALTSNRLAFEDLATDASNAAAIAQERREGLRLVPDTRINLAHVGPTDAVIDFDVKHIVSRRRPSSLANAHGTFTLDHGKAVAKPLTIGLTQGTITGVVTIDQQDGGPVPTVTLALNLGNSSIGALAGGGGAVTGSLRARGHLVGRGSTLRQAVGKSDGHIGVVARDGTLPAKIASLLGFDVARGLTTGDDKRAGLRCVAIGLDMKHGTGTLDPMVIDTTRAQSHGTGTISFPSEQLAIRITGAPKAKSVLRLPGAIIASGTIRDPQVETEKGTKSVGNILKAIGQSISGHQAPNATDADCDALAAKALG